MLITSSLIALALQVGPNTAGPDQLGTPEELLNRPAREEPQSEASDPATQWLVECLDLVAQDPARAHSQAQIRRSQSIGTDRVLANHCLGLAATELQLWDDAIGAFIAARDETPDDEKRARARFGAMAGNAAIGAGDADRALALLRTAKSDAEAAASAPLQAIAATDLARVMVPLGMLEDALTELELATALQPEEASTWLLKATLLRRLERLDEAQTSIERAGELAPTSPEIGLEAGVIAVLSGREDAARQSWQSVIDLAPESPEAQTAQSYLAQIEPALETGP